MRILLLGQTRYWTQRRSLKQSLGKNTQSQLNTTDRCGRRINLYPQIQNRSLQDQLLSQNQPQSQPRPPAAPTGISFSPLCCQRIYLCTPFSTARTAKKPKDFDTFSSPLKTPRRMTTTALLTLSLMCQIKTVVDIVVIISIVIVVFCCTVSLFLLELILQFLWYLK